MTVRKTSTSRTGAPTCGSARPGVVPSPPMPPPCSRSSPAPERRNRAESSGLAGLAGMALVPSTSGLQIAATLGIGSLIFALTRGNTNGWNDAGTLASFAAGAVLLAAFVLIERSSRAPMVPPRSVRDRNRVARTR